MEISGNDLTALDNQSGGFRIQRIPPTERKNRTHTSTVTVAVMKTETTLHSQYDMIDESCFKIEWFSGTGAGGQFRNKHQNSCRVIHLPTGISEARQSRSRDSNLISAMDAIKKTLQQKKQDAIHGLNSQEKKNKLGTGQRGDKLITIQFQNDKVTHHITGKSCRVKDFMNGKMNLIW